MSDPQDEIDAHREVDARVRHDIDAYGWHVVLVPPEDPAPGWGHTIGLFERFDHPELIVFGIDLEVLGPLLNHLGEAVSRGRRLEDGALEEGLIENRPLAFHAVAPKWKSAFLGNAAWHYRQDDVPVLQCFWPDPGGRFPWEEGCDPTWRNDQPLLHEADTQQALPEALIASLRREGAL